MSNLFSTPEWVKDSVFYQIFPDRFAASDRFPKPNNLEPWDSPPTIHGFKGGDLFGIIERLEYLEDLGINAIYLNPIFQSASNHRYHTHDYLRIDPLLGGDGAFQELIDEAHRRDIRIVLDGVFNHTGRGFFQFNHILETGPTSPYIDWFQVYGFPLNAYHGTPNYKCWWDLPALPEFNIANPQVRQFLYDVARYWIERGADGWRLDVPGCIDDDEFWRKFRDVVKNINPDAYIVGEIPHEAQRWLQGDQFDAVMNYQFTQACLGFFAGERIDREVERGLMGLSQTSILNAGIFIQRMQDLINLYPEEASYAQLNLLSSHDMPRFVTLAANDKEAFRMATLFQMTYPGAPCIYYGDEIGMSGGQSGFPEASRAAFNWDQTSWDVDLRSFIQQMISIRMSFPALRRGEFIPLFHENQTFAFSRALGEQKMFIVINNGGENYSKQLPIGDHEFNGSVWQIVYSSSGSHNEEFRVLDGNIHGLTIPPRSGVIAQKMSP